MRRFLFSTTQPIGDAAVREVTSVLGSPFGGATGHWGHWGHRADICMQRALGDAAGWSYGVGNHVIRYQVGIYTDIGENRFY